MDEGWKIGVPSLCLELNRSIEFPMRWNGICSLLDAPPVYNPVNILRGGTTNTPWNLILTHDGTSNEAFSDSLVEVTRIQRKAVNVWTKWSANGEPINSKAHKCIDKPGSTRLDQIVLQKLQRRTFVPEPLRLMNPSISMLRRLALISSTRFVNRQP